MTSLLVERAEADDLPDSTRWQVLSFLRLEWPGVFSGEQRSSRHPSPPSAAPVHFTVTDHDVLVAHAVVLRLTATVDGRPLQVAGLGSVFVFPQYRRQGWARAVVAAASDWTLGSGADLGALCCDPDLASLHARSGWQVRHSGTRLGTPGDAVEAAGTTMVLPVSQSARDLDGRTVHLHCAW